MQLSYYKNLDGLRAIAALAVILAHFCSSENPILFMFIQLGNQGVSLFFVLSGFVITRILINSVYQEKYFINFYIRRTLRIFPLYYFGLLLYTFIPFLLRQVNEPPELSRIWYHFIYLQNFARTFNWNFSGPGHYWSLAVEEHFYLIWPYMVYYAFTKTKNKINSLAIASIGLIALSFILRYILLNDGLEINVFTFTRLDQLSLGCLLAIMEYKKLLTIKSKPLFLAIIFLGIISVGICLNFDYFYNNLFKHNAFGLLFVGLIGYVLVSEERAYINIFLTNIVIQFLGKISYGLYVWHMLVINNYHYYYTKSNSFIDFSLVLGLTILVSWISYTYLEKPFLGLKKKFEFSK